LVAGGGTGVDAQTLSSNWVVYPNPVAGGDGRIFLNSKVDFPLVTAITCWNGLGQNEPVEWTRQGNSIVCQLEADRAPGLYFLRIVTESDSQLHKILINRP
jgi:hypothetical protein